MEPVTHFLTGACISRAGLNRRTAYATLMVTLAAEFPDIDVFWEFKGLVKGFAAHRGFTHSLVGAPVDSAVVLAFVYGVHRWRVKRGKLPALAPRWWVLFLFGILAVLSHILLDFTNNYGVRPFLPFNWRWYSWNIVFIIEPLMLVALFLGLVLPAIFALVGSDIGAKREKFRGRWCAVSALIAVLAIWWVRDFEHRKAVALLNSTDYRGEVAKQVGAMPYPVNPFVWAGIVETDNFYAQVPISLHQANRDPEQDAHVLYKPEPSPVLRAAKQSPLGRVYLDWAQFPLLTAEPRPAPEQGYVVTFRDLRFDYSPLSPGKRTRTPLGASVVLDRNLHVVVMKMGDREQRP